MTGVPVGSTEVDVAASAAAIGREALEARLANAPPWLADRRRAAWDAFTALPMPSSARDEDWRRTDISGLRLDDYVDAAQLDRSLVDAARARRDVALPEAALLINGPGGLEAIEATDSLAAQGVIVTSLAEAAERHPDLVQRGLAGVGVGETAFMALWNALWRGGAFVYVPPGVNAMTPIWISHLISAENGATFPSTVVVLDDNATLTLVQDFAAPADSAARLSVAVSALDLGAEARLDDVVVQQLSAGSWHIATHRATCGRGARYRLYGASLGSRLQKAYWEVVLDGDGAEADIAGVAFADGRQHLDHQSLQSHRGRDTRSNLLLKTAVRDRARSVYSGLIDVEPQAVHTDGYVANRNLLLSHGARASGVPRLEIKANDVRCGHGATVGHIDDDERFYMMARGISAAQADRLIVRGFLADVVDRVPMATTRDWLFGLIEAELGDGPDADSEVESRG